ncbi:hypothetical protein PVAND_002782 [Polypedilum vanderplanki]|uniref:Ig-like domain-containing protein n=1 Tax=Polypedilum vanderplanki TaxID=319348 RepID=A0A9J6BS65_POLVA|nr:hypothetical protein PVAND_002782 [Polypedilum vanderplanki]
MDRKILFFIGLIVLITQYVNCVPVDDYPNDDGDYMSDPKDESDYDGDEFESTDDNKSTTTASQSSDPTEHYIKSKYVAKGDVGKSVVLNCKVPFEIEEDTVIMWYNGTKIIASGSTHSDGKRIKIAKKDGSLTIDEISPYDDAQYRCRVFPAKSKDRYEITIELEVNGPPHLIRIGHNLKQIENVEGKKLTYKAGEKDLRFKCNVEHSRPKAKIVWNRSESLIDESKDHDIQIDEGLLTIKVLHAHHAGEYICEASNEFGIIKSKFELEVEYPPFFSRGHNYFNTEIGTDTEISCIFKATPQFDSAKWFKGSTQLHDSEKYVISNDMKNHHDRMKLLIKNVQKSDLGAYKCEVHNSLGTKKEEIKLDVVPAPPKFEGFKYINNVLFTDWIVKSHQELSSMQILYRNNANGWSQIDATITNSNRAEERPGEWKIQGSISLNSGEWEIGGRAKNSDGWSDDSEVTKIKIPKDSIESSEQTSSASSIVSSMVGVLIAFLLTRYFV